MGLGQRLQEERVLKGLTLEDVERTIKVRKIYLMALEQEAFDQFSAPAYGRGFLRNYARYLGLDPRPLLALYPRSPASAVLQPIASLPQSPRPVASGVLTTLLLFLLALGGFALSQRSEGASPDADRAGQQVVLPALLGTPTPRPPAPTATALPPVLLPQLQPFPVPGSSPTARQETAIPTVTGMPALAARQALMVLGFSVRQEERWDQATAAGIVVAQEPPAGSKALLGSAVTLMVSKGVGGVVVPEVIGLPEGEGQQRLLRAGLANSPWVNYQGYADLPVELLHKVCVGCVLSVTPAPGTEVAPGTVIAMAVRGN